MIAQRPDLISGWLNKVLAIVLEPVKKIHIVLLIGIQQYHIYYKLFLIIFTWVVQNFHRISVAAPTFFSAHFTNCHYVLVLWENEVKRNGCYWSFCPQTPKQTVPYFQLRKYGSGGLWGVLVRGTLFPLYVLWYFCDTRHLWYIHTVGKHSIQPIGLDYPVGLSEWEHLTKKPPTGLQKIRAMSSLKALLLYFVCVCVCMRVHVRMC